VFISPKADVVMPTENPIMPTSRRESGRNIDIALISSSLDEANSLEEANEEIARLRKALHTVLLLARNAKDSMNKQKSFYEDKIVKLNDKNFISH
jgi:hypothetical protein